jgi:hypothetical protein
MLTPAPEHTDPPPEVVGHKTFRQILPTAKQHHTHSVARLPRILWPVSVGLLGQRSSVSVSSFRRIPWPTYFVFSIS